MPEIACTSLRASNPICFMAAVGLLRTCHEHRNTLGTCGLAWQWSEPDWLAVLHSEGLKSAEDLLDFLKSLSFSESRDEFAWRDEVKKLTREEFRERARTRDRNALDWLSALAGEDIFGGKEKPVTPFDTTAGQWKLLAKFRAVHSALFPRPARPDFTKEKFREALLEDWSYSDSEICFNWDPDLVPEGAYCAGNPAKTEKTSVLAATWLAIESLPLFPCDWTGAKLRTRAFTTAPRSEFCWPAWMGPLSLPALKSMLGMPDLTASRPPLGELRRCGIVAVYRSRRWNPSNYGALAQSTLCRVGKVASAEALEKGRWALARQVDQ